MSPVGKPRNNEFIRTEFSNCSIGIDFDVTAGYHKRQLLTSSFSMHLF